MSASQIGWYNVWVVDRQELPGAGGAGGHPGLRGDRTGRQGDQQLQVDTAGVQGQCYYIVIFVTCNLRVFFNVFLLSFFLLLICTIEYRIYEIKDTILSEVSKMCAISTQVSEISCINEHK